MKLINNNPGNYAELRNITFFERERILEIDDLFSKLNKLKHKLTGIAYTQFYKGFFFSFSDQKTPCHFFNTINLGRNPWVVTFETSLPRLGNAGKFWYDIGVKSLAKSNCRKLIALSQCAFNRQAEYVLKNYPDLSETIKSKMIVLHPPQEVLVEEYDAKILAKDSITFTLVGADFFRKGGREILNVFAELIPVHPHLKLVIISSLEFGDYASVTTQEDLEKAKEIIQRFPGNITHHFRLPNKEVLEVLRNSHVGLLPSWGDSYGYFVLEAQAAGCPVITTDLRAFPEINNNTLGWLLNVPLNKGMDGDIDTKEKRINFQEILEKGIRAAILEILNSPGLIEKKGKLCIQRIKEEHSPERYKKRLEEIYMENFKEEAR
jgi:glycosyltransferase involved in cell wall biosynthesis